LGDGQGAVTVVMVFSGEYDLASKDHVRAALDAVSRTGRLALDFSDVTYMDSSIIHELIQVHNVRAACDLERETLVVRNTNLLRIFNILSLASVFRVVDSLDAAIGKNGQQITVRYANEGAVST